MLQNCNTDLPKCRTLEKDLSATLSKKTIIIEDDTIQEYRDIGKDTITGGYYTFKNGFLKSYYFLTEEETGYVPKTGDELLENNESNQTSLCSYAELYDDKGQLINTLGIPSVFRYVKFIRPDSIYVNAKFFALNKTYSNIQVETNSGYHSTISLTNDSVFSNMKQASFQFHFGKKKRIWIYISGTFVQMCSSETKKFADTISLRYEDGKSKVDN